MYCTDKCTHYPFTLIYTFRIKELPDFYSMFVFIISQLKNFLVDFNVYDITLNVEPN